MSKYILHGIYDSKTSLMLTVTGWRPLVNSNDLSVIYYQKLKRANKRIEELKKEMPGHEFDICFHHTTNLSGKIIAD